MGAPLECWRGRGRAPPGWRGSFWYDAFHCARADELRSAGLEPIVVDVFDAPALTQAMVNIAPNVVVHQLTDLALIHDPSRLEEALTRNTRLRTEGTRNLVVAAVKAGARRMIT